MTHNIRQLHKSALIRGEAGKLLSALPPNRSIREYVKIALVLQHVNRQLLESCCSKKKTHAVKIHRGIITRGIRSQEQGEKQGVLEKSLLQREGPWRSRR